MGSVLIDWRMVWSICHCPVSGLTERVAGDGGGDCDGVCKLMNQKDLVLKILGEPGKRLLYQDMLPQLERAWNLKYAGTLSDMIICDGRIVMSSQSWHL
jgi:hypothetical protein